MIKVYILEILRNVHLNNGKGIMRNPVCEYCISVSLRCEDFEM